jgi:hypothetical protein
VRIDLACMRKGRLGDLVDDDRGCEGRAATGRCRKAGFVSTIRCGLARAVLGFFAVQVGKPRNMDLRFGFALYADLRTAGCSANCLLAPVITAAGSFIASGSIVMANDTLHWLEY